MKSIRYILAIILFLSSGIKTYCEVSERIVSLAPSLTNMIYLLEAQDQLIGCTSYCDLAIKDNKDIIGTATEVNIEKIFMLKPNQVIATKLTKQSIIDALRKLGLNVTVLPNPNSYNGICQQFIKIAKIIGKEELANKIVTEQSKRLAQLQKRIPNDKKPKVFFEIGAKPLFTVIPNTFMDDFITFIGGVNIASDMKHGTVTRESVLLKNPDVIVIATMGILGIEEKETWMNYKEISASKNEKIFVVNSDKACSPNPVTFIDIVEQLITEIYQ